MQITSERTFFQRYAILILMAAFFLLPFGLRGARLAVRGMRNDVKDWLPSDFAETSELKWFRDHFSSEAFIMATWDGCTGSLDDPHFRLFVDKFFPETPPSQRTNDANRLNELAQVNGIPAGADEPSEEGLQNIGDIAVSPLGDDERINTNLGLYVRQLPPNALNDRDQFPGNEYGLYLGEDLYADWGGQQEKWLRGEGTQWYYILPNGELYRWTGMDSWVGRAGRLLQRWFSGQNSLAGELIFEAGAQDGPWYYADPRRLEADLFKTVMTGPSVVHMLTREGGALAGNPAAAMERLKGTLFGEEGENTCILLTLTEHGRQNLHQVLGRGMLGRPHGRLLRIAADAGLQAPGKPSLWPPPLDRWFGQPELGTGPVFRMGGPPVDNVAIDEEGQVTLVRLVGLSVLLGLIISWFSFRSIAVTLVLFFVGMSSAVASLGFVWWSGKSMDAVLMSMPSLVYVLGISGAVHIVNYYRDTVAEHGFPGNPANALRLGWKPCTLAAFTTALGLVSLANADIVPISKFGIFSAIAVVFTLVLMFTVVPAALQLWPPVNFVYPPHDASQKKRSAHDLVQAMWFRVASFILKRHILVASVCLVILALGVMGVQRINTTVQLLKLFHPESKIITDYTWLESNLGKLVPMELVARVQPSMIRTGELQKESEEEQENAGRPAAPDPEDRFRLSFLDRMQITEHIRAALDERFSGDTRDVVGSSMMAATFVPPLPKAGGAISQTAMRGAYSRQLVGYRQEIIQSDYFRVEQETDAELWRISLRLAALTDVDYGEFVNDIKTAVEPVMAAYKYRRFVLHKIDRQRGGDGFRGGRVLVLGIYRSDKDENKAKVEAADAAAGESSDGEVASAAAAEATDESAGRPSVAATAAEPQEVIDTGQRQWRVFSHTFEELLTNAALRVTRVDPRMELPENWLADLDPDKYDCIVLVQDDPRFAGIKERKDLPFIDATNFHYDGKETSVTAAEADEPVQVVYTGLVPVVYKAQRTLLNNLIKSTFWAFVSITIVMALLLRSLQAGMVSMLPNIFPVIIVFGVMGFTGVLVDIGSMMTASVAMGVAVDDTIHFLTWFRRGLDQGMDRKQSILLAFDRCATAMTQTTMIAGLGLSVFALSTFTPTQRFGVLMLTLMATALLGDLIFLPAILAGPGGRVFEKLQAKASSRGTNAGAAESTDSSGNAKDAPSNDGPTPHATPRVSSDKSL